jgi:hypothetical protein
MINHKAQAAYKEKIINFKEIKIPVAKIYNKKN